MCWYSGKRWTEDGFSTFARRIEWSSDDKVIAMVESHPSCMVLATRLERGKDPCICFISWQHTARLLSFFKLNSRIKYINGKLVGGCHCTWNHGASVRLLVDAYPAAMFFRDRSNDRTLSNWTSTLESRQRWVSRKYGCCRCSFTSLSYLFVANQFVRDSSTSKSRVLCTHFSESNDRLIAILYIIAQNILLSRPCH